MKILGLDFETTGLNPTDARVIEVGAVIWDTEKGQPDFMMSELVKPEGFSSVPAEITEITGIDTEMVNEFGESGSGIFKRLFELIQKCDYVMAHNADFDRQFFESEMRAYQIDGDPTSVKWLDSMIDVPYPKSIQTRKLTYLAAEHQILNPYAHRAVFDVLVMLQVVQKYSIEDVVQRSQSPSVHVVARVSFDEKDKAKKLGFRWHASEKKWAREYKQMDVESMQFPFEIDVSPM